VGPLTLLQGGCAKVVSQDMRIEAVGVKPVVMSTW
jgi:hypothetical protein